MIALRSNPAHSEHQFKASLNNETSIIILANSIPQVFSLIGMIDFLKSCNAILFSIEVNGVKRYPFW